jgi:hypothetical protein
LDATDGLEALAVMSANDKQVDGEHYQLEIQPWDYITLNRLGYLEGNIIKYVTRHKEKNGVKDLEKAKHYIDKLIEVAYGITQASQE